MDNKVLLTVAVSFSAASQSGGFDGFRELGTEVEAKYAGAGNFTHNDCLAVAGFDCVNNVAIGGPCGPANNESIACVTRVTPKQCTTRWFPGFGECTVTVTRNCSDGVIVICAGGVWTDKLVGNAYCGSWDDC